MQHLPTIELVRELEPEELAMFVLQCLNDMEGRDPNSMHLGNFIVRLRQNVGYEEHGVLEAYTEAWMWLEREVMIAPSPTRGSMIYVTRRGTDLLRQGSLGAYQRTNLLRAMNLDPQLARKVSPTYLRGDYDTAVFQAFKEVEVRVRTAGKFGNGKIGKDLMRAAFHPENGPLTKMDRESGERQSISDLFAGAIGVLKNPGSHRDTEIDDPQEAAEAILFANHLLRIVDGQPL